MFRTVFLTSSMLLAFASFAGTDQESQQSERIKRGEYLFKGACGAYCHSVTAELRDAPYLFDCEWLHGGSDKAVYEVIYKGVSGTRMPGFGSKLPNGEEDIWQIIEFLKAKRQSCE